MSKIAVIGGSRFTALKNLVITHSTTVKTPYGDPSAPLSYGILGDREVVYLPRRDNPQTMPPHKINYRANLWALRDAGVQTVIATAAVASICDTLKTGDLVLPDQLVDYTYGRENTFLGEDASVNHIHFAQPYSENLRQKIADNAQKLGYHILTRATYGVMQGPRLETVAEVGRLSRDGCHLVGMTGMPETALARELGLNYACIAVVVRKAGCQEENASLLKVRHAWVEDLIEAFILEPVCA